MLWSSKEVGERRGDVEVAVEEDVRKVDKVVELGLGFVGLWSWSSFSEDELKRSAKGSCRFVSVGVCICCVGEKSRGERDLERVEVEVLDRIEVVGDVAAGCVDTFTGPVIRTIP